MRLWRRKPLRTSHGFLGRAHSAISRSRSRLQRMKAKNSIGFGDRVPAFDVRRARDHWPRAFARAVYPGFAAARAAVLLTTLKCRKYAREVKGDFIVRLLEKVGVSKDRVSVERESRNTLENACICQGAMDVTPLSDERHWHNGSRRARMDWLVGLLDHRTDIGVVSRANSEISLPAGSIYNGSEKFPVEFATQPF